MKRYIDADALYERTAEWEAQALAQVERTMNDEDKTEWKKWSVILTERSAFKFDVADAPTADVRENVKGKWIYQSFGGWHCNQCGKQAPFWCMASTQNLSVFCPNCGADMRGAE